jgi:ankyrin repeat protein
MEAYEEAQRRKELAEFRDLEETVGIAVSDYLAPYDFRNRGKDVNPSGKDTLFLSEIAEMLKDVKSSSGSNSPMKRKSSLVDDGDGEVVDSNVRDFDLEVGNRIHVNQGPVHKREPDGILRRVSRKYLFLFTDVLLICTSKKDVRDKYELNQVIWLRDLRFRSIDLNDGEDEKVAFELVVVKPRGRGFQSTITIICDNEHSKNGWVNDIEASILAYHKDTPKLGWFHDLILGTIYSAAHTGDTVLLRRHLHRLSARGISIDRPDAAGMAALHWAVLAGHEVCVRILLDHGADVDCLQHGNNTPLLLAAARGYDSIVRLLLDRGANVRAVNRRERDALFMAVVYGHAAKGLPWVLQILGDRGLNLNQVDTTLATPLHICAEKNLARPVRMLVDAGADVNARHGRTSLTPVLMACNQAHPDVETIRSFLDKGAYPNWRDVQGRTAFSLIIYNQTAASRVKVPRVGLEDGGWNSTDRESEIRESVRGNRWRDMDDTIEEVGDWATKALPALLEITKRGNAYGSFSNDTSYQFCRGEI